MGNQSQMQEVGVTVLKAKMSNLQRLLASKRSLLVRVLENLEQALEQKWEGVQIATFLRDELTTKHQVNE